MGLTRSPAFGVQADGGEAPPKVEDRLHELAPRRPARTRADSALVSLAEQDRARWNAAAIAEGELIVATPPARAPIGPYQRQAAIAAVHDEVR